jgi:hypothetical protein
MVLDNIQREKIIPTLKKANVQQINLYGYFWGKFESPLEKMIKAREILQENGFEVGVCTVPVGHPGNSVDPLNPTLDLHIPKHWRYRIDRNGNPVYHCADIEEQMINDNRNAILLLKSAGFRIIFFDDDLRMGNWGTEIQGCFCEVCLRQFNEQYYVQYHNQYPNAISRQNLADAIIQNNNHPLLSDWVEFTCNKVNSFIKSMRMEGIEIGMMVMHRGDERHGIAIESIRKIIPSIHIRVGECHFGDRSFNPPLEKASELLGMIQHLSLIDKLRAYSESTVFPPGALSPENLLLKCKMALMVGIPNLYIMNGVGFLDQLYWDEIISHISELKELEKEYEGFTLESPIHVLCGTHGSYQEPIEIPAIPLLTGLPIKPIRLLETDQSGQILIIMGKFKVHKEWMPKIANYKWIIFDRIAAKLNRDFIQHYSHNNDEQINTQKTEIRIIPTHILTSILSPKTKFHSHYAIQNLRKMIIALNPSFPFISNGENMCIFWLKNINRTVIFNLEVTPNQGMIKFGNQSRTIKLPPNGIEIIHWIE